MDTNGLTSQVATIIGQLHGLFDDIGLSSHDRDAREAELFTALSETLNDQLRLVASEKNEMTEEAKRIISIITQMEISLEDNKTDSRYDLGKSELKITYPLARCLQALREKHASISKVHKERYEQVRKLVEAFESYASHLEPSFVKIELPPTSLNSSTPPTFDLSPSYVAALDNEFTRVYEEYTRRVSLVTTTPEEIVKFWAELGTPQAQTDTAIVKYYRDAPEQLGLHEEDLARLKNKREKLVEEKRARERRLRELKQAVEGLWERLEVDMKDRKAFSNTNRGCGLRVINEYEDELSRLNELKHQNLHLFVEDARYKLQELWDSLYFSEEEMLEFTPAFSDVYSDALLSAHEAEISRLLTLREQRAPTLQMIEKHKSLIKDREQLTASSQDASRLMMKGQKGEKRDPTRLLREEKMRKRIAKDLPKVEVELRKVLERWEDEYGRPFLVHGERYLDETAAAARVKAPPGRTKTPAPAPLPASRGAKGLASSQRGGAPRLAPSRAGAKTPLETVRRPNMPSSASTKGTSPSKIPARKALGNLAHGNNSPERRELPYPPSVQSSHSQSTSSKMGPPMRAPPPKMRTYVNSSSTDATPVPEDYAGVQRCASAMSSNESVRHISPEDLYDDRERMSYVHSSLVHGSRQQLGQGRSHQTQVTGSRQISTTSSASNTVSGSENWETYDDASDLEPDASDAYYERLRAARGKRFTPDDAYSQATGGPSKRIRGLPAAGAERAILVGTDGEEMYAAGRVPSGSEAGWQDYDEGC